MPLHGRVLAITRPAAQAETLVARIREAGGTPLRLPLISISAQPEAVCQHPAAQDLSPYALAIFISPNAVHHSLPELLRCQPWPKHLRIAAVGSGTADALAEYGLNSIQPTNRFDSEGLLACPELQTSALAGQRVLLVKGEGGRDLLAATLTQRGAIVDALACYRRSAPKNLTEPLWAAWQNGPLDGLLLTSSEGLRNLLDALSEDDRNRLLDTPVFTPHPRIADNARLSGFSQVILTPPAEAGLLTGLLAYNWAD